MSIKQIIPLGFTATAQDITDGLANNLPVGSLISVVDTNGQPTGKEYKATSGNSAPIENSGGSLKAWAANTMMSAGEIRRATVTVGTIGIGDFISSNSARVTGATFDATEATNWMELPDDPDFTMHKNDTANPHGVTKSQVSLGNVDNTADINKIVSTAQQTALDGKSATTHNHAGTYEPSNANIQSHIVSTVNPHSVNATQVGLGNVSNTSDANKPVSTAQQTALDGKSATSHAHTKADVGLGSADNTADTAKPVSTAQQTAIDLKAPLASPTFTGTIAGITKTMVGLSDVDNTADSAKPVSTAQQTALDGKHELYSLGHPYATAATTHGHTVTASSQYNADYAGWKAFQQNPSSVSEWATLGSVAGTLSIELPAPVIFTRCALRGRIGDYPTRWKLEGSNDGSTFTMLLDKTAADESLQYSLGEKVFDFTNTIPYKFYRFNYTAWVGNNVGLNSIRWSHQGINILNNTSLTDGSVSAQFDELRFDRVRVISDTDLNVLAVSGFYDGTNLTNAPVASTSWFYVEHLQHSNAVAPGWAMQKAYGLGSPNSGAGAAGTMYVRTKVNGVWQAWRTVTTT